MVNSKTITYSDIELKPMPKSLTKVWGLFCSSYDEAREGRFSALMDAYNNEVELRRIKALNLKNKKPRKKKVYIATSETLKWAVSRNNYECGDLLDIMKHFPGGKKGFVNIGGITVNVTKLRKLLTLHKYEFIKEIASVFIDVNGETDTYTERWYSKRNHGILSIDNPNYNGVDVEKSYLVIQLQRDSFRLFNQEEKTEASINFS